MLITKAIIPAAGRGLRFLPATKAIPKELLPLIDKPAIQYVVEEGISSGIKDFVFVTNKDKRAIVDHFSEDFPINFVDVRQSQRLGLGHAVWTARHAVGDSHIAIMLPDDIFMGVDPGIGQLIKVAIQEKCSVVAVQEVSRSEVGRYGIVDVKKQFSPNLFQLRDVIEKPAPDEAPSCLAIVGRYILAPTIFEALEQTGSGAIGEVQLTDGIQKMILGGEKVFAYKIKGTRYDAGTPFGLLKSSVMLALRNPKYSRAMLEFLSELDRKLIALQGKSDIFSKLSGI
jgi:UTP--glucose-1-phosphate uridylyltransferase